MQTYGLEWRQVTSILLDNCAVMRGKKSGLETQARKENPYLLDVSGDTVHMVSNAAKALMSPFSTEVENFCSDVYYDIEKSPKQKEIFSEFQSLLHLPSKSLIRPISNRFLQMLEVCTRLNELMDVLVVHYYYVLEMKNTNTIEEKTRAEILQQEQATTSRMGTQANLDRKARTSVLFTEFDRFKVMVDMFRGIL
ncbi:hypothetical protein M9458_055165 [Cirrhinus mrigala]|uniref:Uncharacterized protein n=1 Tax=Cirrhinus mrigala TaxID=683832 RepID=A0ABD0MKL5_CIRMR